MVVFPPGTYVCFSLQLKSHVHLHLQQGSTLLAADSPCPASRPAIVGHLRCGRTQYALGSLPGLWPQSLAQFAALGRDIQDFSITGNGPDLGQRTVQRARPQGDGAPFVAEQPGVGNKAIALKNCRNGLVRDVSILKAGHFGLLLTGVDNITLDNLKIDTDRDGIDIDCCQNVRVSNCTVNSPWDDGICPKSSFALGYARPTRNVTITNCWVTGYYELGTVLDGSFKKFAPDFRVPRTGRIKFGTESNGGFINMAVSNCVFEGCQGYALESEDGRCSKT